MVAKSRVTFVPIPPLFLSFPFLLFICSYHFQYSFPIAQGACDKRIERPYRRVSELNRNAGVSSRFNFLNREVEDKSKQLPQVGISRRING